MIDDARNHEREERISRLFPVYFRIRFSESHSFTEGKMQVPSVRVLKASREIGVSSSPILNLGIRSGWVGWFHYPAGLLPGKNRQFPLRLDYGRLPHAYVNQRLQIQLELLMMSGMPLETRWAFNERWNNKFYYMVASCWLFLLNRHYPLNRWLCMPQWQSEY
jgi:hypothetical protein